MFRSLMSVVIVGLTIRLLDNYIYTFYKQLLNSVLMKFNIMKIEVRVDNFEYHKNPNSITVLLYIAFSLNNKNLHFNKGLFKFISN